MLQFIVFSITLLSSISFSTTHPTYQYKDDVHHVTAIQVEEFFKKTNISKKLEFCSAYSDSCNSYPEEYCVSQVFVRDHCFCEHYHSDEGLPYFSHSCESIVNVAKFPSHGSCMEVYQMEKCCCLQRHAEMYLQNKVEYLSFFAPFGPSMNRAVKETTSKLLLLIYLRWFVV